MRKYIGRKELERTKVHIGMVRCGHCAHLHPLYFSRALGKDKTYACFKNPQGLKDFQDLNFASCCSDFEPKEDNGYNMYNITTCPHCGENFLQRGRLIGAKVEEKNGKIVKILGFTYECLSCKRKIVIGYDMPEKVLFS